MIQQFINMLNAIGAMRLERVPFYKQKMQPRSTKIRISKYTRHQGAKEMERRRKWISQS